MIFSRVKSFVLILFLIFCTSNLAHTETTQMLPEKLPDGFNLTQPVAFYNSGNIFELINGQAVFYLSYGFIRLEHAFYEKEGVTYTIDIYELADRLSAFGSYRQQKDEDAYDLDVGCEGYIIDYLSVFYKDKYYVEIIPGESGDDNISAMKLLAAQVEKRIPGTSEIPPELDLLPVENIVPGSERYFGENLISYTFMGHGLTAKYMNKQEDKNITVFISFTGSEQEAQKIYNEFEEKMKDPKTEVKHKFEYLTITGVTGALPYRGEAAIYTYKNYAFGFYGFSDIEETEKISVNLLRNLRNTTLSEDE